MHVQTLYFEVVGKQVRLEIETDRILPVSIFIEGNDFKIDSKEEFKFFNLEGVKTVKEWSDKSKAMVDETLCSAFYESLPTQPKPPKLDFGGKTIDDRLWRTVDGRFIVIWQFDEDRRVWLGWEIDKDGKKISGPQWVEFTEEGDNQELGYLVKRKRGSETGWPVVREVEG